MLESLKKLHLTLFFVVTNCIKTQCKVEQINSHGLLVNPVHAEPIILPLIRWSYSQSKHDNNHKKGTKIIFFYFMSVINFS